METLTSVIKMKTKKIRILPSRSGDDGAPCAIARLVLAQAQISNQQKTEAQKSTPKDGVSCLF